MFPRSHYSLPLPGGRTLALGERTLVMGVLNVTPDSFAEGASRVDPDEAVERALTMAAAGADLIDVGGESTRPGAAPVSADEELRRVVPVLDRLASRLAVPLSIDTSKAAVAEAALARGVEIVNDISGLRYDPALAPLVAASGAVLVTMHMRGRPADMYQAATYDDVVAAVMTELADNVRLARASGIRDDRIIVDPGLGFAKRPPHSYELLARLDALAALGYPLLVGASRKSFLQSSLGVTPAVARDWATAAAVTAAVLAGAHIVRVHAVAEMVQVVRVADEIRAHAAGHLDT